jgi:hypothetical protein
MDHPSEVPDFLPSLKTPKVLLAEVAVISGIFAILRWQAQLPLWANILIALIILIGITAVYGLAKEEFNLRRAKHLLALKLEQGQALFDKTRLPGDPQVSVEDLQKWNDLTEQDLRKHVDEAHVARFRFAGFRDQPESFTTYRLEAKLVFLDELLKQLKG